jgi:hypothetical protein
MINLNLNNKKLIGLTFILLFLVSAISMNLIPKEKTNPAYESSNMKPDVDQDITDKIPKPSLPPPSYSWWNASWSFRIPVSISSTSDQVDAPVELFINFTENANVTFVKDGLIKSISFISSLTFDKEFTS